MQKDHLRGRSIAHVPGVFSHYSPTTGSALITKVYQHARALEDAGGTAYVLVNETREASYDAGTVIRFRSPRAGGREWFSDGERRLDAMLGAAVGRRPLIARYWRPALLAIPEDADAAVIYNQPGAAPPNRQHGTWIKVLHLGNDPFRSWKSHDIVTVLRHFDLTVTVSDFTAAGINARLPASCPRVRVLRNGVDTRSFYPADHQVDSPPEILFVGNMVPHKGAHNLLLAAHHLLERKVEFNLTIVGSWGLSEWNKLTQYERRLRRLASPLGTRVKFQQFTDRARIPETFRRASIFCMPVEWDEPAGQVVTEAMASGIPVISAKRGGIPEYLGPDGVYVDPSDTKEFASSLEFLLSEPSHRRSLGAKLRERACEMDWDRRAFELCQMIGFAEP